MAKSLLGDTAPTSAPPAVPPTPTDSDVGTGNAKMRPSVFYNLLGEDYIPTAFKMARDAGLEQRVKAHAD